MEHLSKITKFFNSLVEVLLPIVSVSVLLGVIFGPDTPLVGDVYSNLANILNLLGEDALLALVSIVIILAFLKK